MVNVIFE